MNTKQGKGSNGLQPSASVLEKENKVETNLNQVQNVPDNIKSH